VTADLPLVWRAPDRYDRALRIGEEPLDAFRRYMSVYAREQAHCHFSPARMAARGRRR